MCLFALIYQGISFEHAKEVRKTYLNPALFSYYKEPVFICKVQLWIFTDILKSGRHSVIVFPYHTPIMVLFRKETLMTSLMKLCEDDKHL